MKFNPPNLIILTGPSGVGKTSVALKLLKKHQSIRRIVTYTTRKKRRGEKHGRDYYFIDDKKFKEMRKKGEFFEWAEVYGHYYGNALKDLKDICRRARFCLMVLDLAGAKKIKKEFSKSQAIFLTAEFRELARRLIKRGKMEKRDFLLRQKIAKKELAEVKKFDYAVENKSNRLDETIKKLETILNKISFRKNF